jgi:hypothetical protein
VEGPKRIFFYLSKMQQIVKRTYTINREMGKDERSDVHKKECGEMANIPATGYPES